MSLNRTIAAGLAALALAATGTASAQGGYGGLGAFDWKIKDRGTPGSLESTGVRAVGGYMLNANFGIEGHVASGGSDDLLVQTDSGIEEAEAELNKLLAIFAKANLPIGRANIFGLIGYSTSKVEILAETTTATIYEDSSLRGFSYGAGAEVALIPDLLYLTADYIEYLEKDGLEGTATSIGLRLSFSGQ